jgi:3-hydroxybutyryl-CoA dehydrogenase
MTTRDWSLGVVGGGTMGSGIAICSVRVGVPTVILEVDAERAGAAHERVAAFLARSVAKGKMTEEQRDHSLASLRVVTDIAELSGCNAVIEAIFEDVAAKQELFAKLDAVVSPDALLLSNTSTLSITAIAAGSCRPERVVGLHFCNPAPLMSLVEAVRGLRTDDPSYEAALALTSHLGKTSVRVRDTPGFFLNRLLVPYENDCIRALEAGVATVEEIDLAMTKGLGHPMGPFTLLDTVGLDVHRAVSLSLYEQLKDPRYAPPPLVDQMIAAGRLGRKSGRGFYTYDEAKMFGT